MKKSYLIGLVLLPIFLIVLFCQKSQKKETGLNFVNAKMKVFVMGPYTPHIQTKNVKSKDFHDNITSLTSYKGTHTLEKMLFPLLTDIEVFEKHNLNDSEIVSFQLPNSNWKKCSLPPENGHTDNFLSKPKGKQDIHSVFWSTKKMTAKNAGNDYTRITYLNGQKIGTTKTWKNNISPSFFNLEKYPPALFKTENQSNKNI